MKTIKEMAEISGVSKTSIYNLIKSHNLETLKQDGVTYLPSKTISFITAHYSLGKQETIADMIKESEQFSEQEYTKSDPADPLNNFNKIYDGLKEENAELIDLLKKQLEEKDKTIHSLIQAFNYDKQFQAAQLLTTSKNQVETSEVDAETNKKGFLAKISSLFH